MMGVMDQLKNKRSLSQMPALKNSPQQAMTQLKKNNEQQSLQASDSFSSTGNAENDSK